MTQLQTDRLLLRELTLNDAQYVLGLLNEPSFIQNIGDRGVRTIAEAENYIEKGAINSYKINGFGTLAVLLKQTGEFIGVCGLINRPGLDDVDIGYAFFPKYWSKGYAIESAQAILAQANEIGLKRIVAIVDPVNNGSIRVLEKLGMKFEKIVKLSEDDIDLKLYSIEI